MLLSNTADQALLYPTSIAPLRVLPLPSSSFILSKVTTLASTPIPTASIIPAIPGIVKVKLSILGKNPEIAAIVHITCPTRAIEATAPASL